MSRGQGCDRHGDLGQDKVIEQALVTHPVRRPRAAPWRAGLAKTKLVDTLGTVLGLDARRIQFTPDLMPSTFSAPRCSKKARPASAASASCPVRYLRSS